MNIRYANLDDLDFIYEGIIDTKQCEGEKNSKIKDKHKKEFTKGIKDKSIRIAEKDKKAIGFIFFKENFSIMYEKSDFLWVQLIYVNKEFRKQGVAKDLYNDLIKISKSKNIKNICCDVFSINKGSALFHEKIGFKPKYTIYKMEIE